MLLLVELADMSTCIAIFFSDSMIQTDFLDVSESRTIALLCSSQNVVSFSVDNQRRTDVLYTQRNKQINRMVSM